MKSVGDFQILKHPHTGLNVDHSFVTALGIRQDTVLQGIVLKHSLPKNANTSKEGSDLEHRLMTLVVTPFPHASWSRLIRIAVTIDPRPGSLYRLVHALNQLHLYSRYLADVTGTSSYATGKVSDLVTGEPILSSATFVLELPQEGHDRGELDLLHQSLRKVIPPSSNANAREDLQQALKKQDPELELAVQWISPMATLNKLSKESAESILIEKRSDSAGFQVRLPLHC